MKKIALRQNWFTTLVPWEAKKRAIVWRGSTTGTGLRNTFVHNLARHHNVKFTMPAVQHRSSWVNETWTHAEKLSMYDQLQYRYVLSLQGNDVATDLKWKLSQNSVVVMPKPTVETWLMEGLLQPWVHYVPIEDPKDMHETLQWLNTHEEDCIRIVSNAQAWMKHMTESVDFRPLLDYVLDFPWPDLVWNDCDMFT